MALASVLSSDFAELSVDNCQPFKLGSAPGESVHGFDATPGDGLSFLVKEPLWDVGDDGVERKIEFLHGTTTLAFKVSTRVSCHRQHTTTKKALFLYLVVKLWLCKLFRFPFMF